MRANFAAVIAQEAHAGQTRDGGDSYINHVCRVYEAVRDAGFGDDHQAVAWLHDVAEDTDVTLDHLRDGFPEHIVEAVDAITKRKCDECAGRGSFVRSALLAEAVDRIRQVPAAQFLTPPVVADLAEAACGPHICRTCPVCSGSGCEKRTDYLARVKANPIALVVKWYDACDNRDDDGRPGMRERYEWVLEQLGGLTPVGVR